MLWCKGNTPGVELGDVGSNPTSDESFSDAVV